MHLPLPTKSGSRGPEMHRMAGRETSKRFRRTPRRATPTPKGPEWPLWRPTRSRLDSWSPGVEIGRHSEYMQVRGPILTQRDGHKRVEIGPHCVPFGGEPQGGTSVITPGFQQSGDLVAGRPGTTFYLPAKPHEIVLARNHVALSNRPPFGESRCDLPGVPLGIEKGYPKGSTRCTSGDSQLGTATDRPCDRP